MIFTTTKLKGVYIVGLERLEDERGFFARSWCNKEFEAHGLNPDLAQCNISFNKKKSTLRGMHYQSPPHDEAKLLRCTQGAIYDVTLDVRKESPTYKQWESFTLTADNYQMLYIPEGFAHGFQTLEDNTEVFYQMTEFYHPESAKGIRYNDPAFNISWPASPLFISPKDMQYPNFHA